MHQPLCMGIIACAVCICAWLFVYMFSIYIWICVLPWWFSGKKNLLLTQETQEMQIWSLSQEDPLEEVMATYSSIVAGKIPWTGAPGRLHSLGVKRVRHNWATKHADTPHTDMCLCICWYVHIYIPHICIWMCVLAIYVLYMWCMLYLYFHACINI